MASSTVCGKTPTSSWWGRSATGRRPRWRLAPRRRVIWCLPPSTRAMRRGAVTRYADLFPQDVQRDVRAQLALSLRVVVAQRLLPDIEKGMKRHLALEVLWNTYPIASAIRTGKIESIDNYL